MRDSNDPEETFSLRWSQTCARCDQLAVSPWNDSSSIRIWCAQTPYSFEWGHSFRATILDQFQLEQCLFIGLPPYLYLSNFDHKTKTTLNNPIQSDRSPSKTSPKLILNYFNLCAFQMYAPSLHDANQHIRA